MDYNFRKIEQEWQEKWKKDNAYKVSSPIEGETPKPKYYVLDMFPYPSGAGLHVGHPLGYISSDIYARYKRLKGYNVLHPMGYDAFGLPAEQYAIEHGVHPAVSTDQNIKNFRGQMENIGFSFDWDREVKTSDPHYYKWTQWIFLQLFGSWYNRTKKSADSIENLVAIFEKEGNGNYICPGDKSIVFTAEEWKSFDEKRHQDILMEYRLSFCGYGEVNWCEALGTVLANDEVVNGVSERGGYPVEKKRLRQWYLRITEYADRLLEGLEKVEFSDSMKEMQTNWIGKSYGAEIDFKISQLSNLTSLTPDPSPQGERGAVGAVNVPKYNVASAAQFDLAKELRKGHTEAEKALWDLVRDSKLGVKFRRQHPIESYIVDFISLQNKLIVEVDGGYHETEEQQAYDTNRTRILNEIGFQVLRFSNEEIMQDPYAVRDKIKQHLDAAAPPLPLGRGDGGEGGDLMLRVYTTRPDTIFGVDFMVIAPEHELIESITTAEQKQAVDEYIAYVKSRSERERMAEKKITGCFTGAYAINPFNDHKIPVWISEYVLAGYGTGAIMAVPCGDERDHKFAQHFNIPITNIIGSYYDGQEANPTKDAKLENSGFLNGMVMRDAIEVVVQKLEEMGIGKKQVNYRMRDAAFSRQRYWGEPFPIVWKDGIAYPLSENQLPVLLPHMDELKPGPDAEGPLANLDDWKHYDGGIREVNTMPGYAGSSWYFLRYMDPHNDTEFCNRKISDYWGQVDLYIGGTEHAVGHLLYSRMWTKALFDLGHIGFDEPFRKLLNQGMIQGSSRLVYRIRETNQFVSAGLKDSYETDEIHIDVNMVDGVDLDIDAFRKWRTDYTNATFILENGEVLDAGAPLSPANSRDGEGPGVRYICGTLVEKMSKRLYNTVNPDDLVLKFGADTFRMYEMFLGPVEASKPWDTKGIEGVHRFLRKLWRLFYDEAKGKVWNNDKPTDAELKVLHKAIRKIEEDTERFSFNTAVSTFMICVNDLADLKCNKKEVLDQLLVLLTPYAPHIAEELWHLTGNTSSVLDASYPVFNAKYVTETSKEYPVSINGKTRTTINIALDATPQEVDEIVLNNEIVQKWLEGKSPKKIIFVKGKMVNVVI